MIDLKYLHEVNDAYNGLVYAADVGQDYWQTPKETDARGAGDCEDKQIAKFFGLLDKGFEHDKLCLVVAKLERILGAKTEYHMVLTYDNGSCVVVLDNVIQSIHPISWREDLKPIYGFNINRRWLVRSKRIDHVMHWEFEEASFSMGKWDALLKKMQEEDKNKFRGYTSRIKTSA